MYSKESSVKRRLKTKLHKKQACWPAQLPRRKEKYLQDFFPQINCRQTLNFIKILFLTLLYSNASRKMNCFQHNFIHHLTRLVLIQFNWSGSWLTPLHAHLLFITKAGLAELVYVETRQTEPTLKTALQSLSIWSVSYRHI